MVPTYIKKLGLRIQKTIVVAQKINRLTLETYSMVITDFYI